MTDYPAHVYAADTESTGVHPCPRCQTLVTWGSTNKGNRSRFDYPADSEGRYVNHNVTCPMTPGKERTRRLVEPSDAPSDCAECRAAIVRGSALCRVHWAQFRSWMSSLKPDAFTIWQLGNRHDRRALLRQWRKLAQTVNA